MKKYQLLVYIGRFQPFHNAHKRTIELASTKAKNVLVIIGSAYEPRTYKNPFTVPERHKMISETIKHSDKFDSKCTLLLERAEDYRYDDVRWANNIRSIVAQFGYKSVGLIGHNKDDSSFYLKLFPEWDLIDVEKVSTINATDIRSEYFREDAHSFKLDKSFYKHRTGKHVTKFLESFIDTPEFEYLAMERAHIVSYRNQYVNMQYEPIFVTADALVTTRITSDTYILLITRKSEYGNGLLALPGGFVDANSDRTIQHAMLRELIEETGITTPRDVLERCVTKTQVFDHINRSARGRTITHVFHIELASMIFPKCTAGDDAADAKWYNIADLEREHFFEDHYDIILTMLGI